MNALVTLTSGSAASITSREIAELTGKEHFHVLRDIRALKEQLGTMFGGAIQTWIHPKNGQQYEEYALDKDTCMTLLLGYDAVARMKVVKRWQELEQQAALGAFNLPKTMSEALRLAADQADRIEALESTVSELKPKAAFARQVEVAPDAITTAQAAKILGTGRNRFIAWLREIHFLTRFNEPYQDKIEAGLLDVKLGSWDHPDHGLRQSVTTLITGKGLVKLQQMWAVREMSLGLLPLK